IKKLLTNFMKIIINGLKNKTKKEDIEKKLLQEYKNHIKEEFGFQKNSLLEYLNIIINEITYVEELEDYYELQLDVAYNVLTKMREEIEQYKDTTVDVKTLFDKYRQYY